jgi:hypothetical protein
VKGEKITSPRGLVVSQLQQTADFPAGEEGGGDMWEEGGKERRYLFTVCHNAVYSKYKAYIHLSSICN